MCIGLASIRDNTSASVSPFSLIWEGVGDEGEKNSAAAGDNAAEWLVGRRPGRGKKKREFQSLELSLSRAALCSLCFFYGDDAPFRDDARARLYMPLYRPV